MTRSSNDAGRVWSFGLEFRGEDCEVLIRKERGCFESFIQIPNPLPSDEDNKDFVYFSFPHEPTVDELMEIVEGLYVP